MKQKDSNPKDTKDTKCEDRSFIPVVSFESVVPFVFDDLLTVNLVID